MNLPRFNVNEKTGDVFADPEGKFVLMADAVEGAKSLMAQTVHLANAINAMGINAGIIAEPTMDVLQLGLICKELETRYDVVTQKLNKLGASK